MSNKDEERLISKNIRKNSDIENISEILCKRIQETDIFKNSNHIMIFYPLKYEINLLSLLNTDKQFYLPRMSNDNLECCRWDNNLKQGKFKVMEPTGDAVDKQILDLVIMPALAVDKTGNRLGYGKGFYDRFISGENHFKTLVPISEKLVFEKISTDPFDIKIDYAITEDNFYLF